MIAIIKRLLILLAITLFMLTSCAETDNNITEKEVAVEDAKDTEETISDNSGEITEDEEITDMESEKKEEKENAEEETTNDNTENIEHITILSEGFEEGKSDFIQRGEGVAIELTENEAYEGGKSLKAYERTVTWHGTQIDLSEAMVNGKLLEITAWVKYNDGFDSIEINAMIEKDGNEYLSFGKVKAEKGKWAKIEGELLMPDQVDSVILYFETEWKNEFTEEDLCDLYIDSVEVREVISVTNSSDIEALKNYYTDYFTIGASIERTDLEYKEIRDIVSKHFDTITCGNEMKPDFILDYEASISDEKYALSPAVDFTRADVIMDFAVENGHKVRGHTLIWHSQTPKWLFTVEYSKDEDAILADRDTMLLRMKNYIKQVLEHFQQKYPDVIFAWDVVNEAVEIEDGHEKGYRIEESMWYETVGDDYIEKAFQYSRKYADPEVKLFYNDYNTFMPERRDAIYDIGKDLKEKGLIDGIGMQGHILMDFPSMDDFEKAVRKFGSLDIEVQVTEMDISLETDSNEMLDKQGERYSAVMDILKRAKDDGINVTNYTVWGVVDNRSWLNREKANYPLLFDKYFNPKPAFYELAK